MGGTPLNPAEGSGQAQGADPLSPSGEYSTGEVLNFLLKGVGWPWLTALSTKSGQTMMKPYLEATNEAYEMPGQVASGALEMERPRFEKAMGTSTGDELVDNLQRTSRVMALPVMAAMGIPALEQSGWLPSSYGGSILTKGAVPKAGTAATAATRAAESSEAGGEAGLTALGEELLGASEKEAATGVSKAAATGAVKAAKTAEEADIGEAGETIHRVHVGKDVTDETLAARMKREQERADKEEHERIRKYQRDLSPREQLDKMSPPLGQQLRQMGVPVDQAKQMMIQFRQRQMQALQQVLARAGGKMPPLGAAQAQAGLIDPASQTGGR